MRRNRLVISSAVSVMLALVVGAVGLGIGFVRERDRGPRLTICVPRPLVNPSDCTDGTTTWT